MKVNIITIGKIKEDYLKSAISEYQKRIKKYAKLSIFEKEESKNNARSNKMIITAKQEEGESLLSTAKGYLIALDLRGEMLSSEELAAIIKEQKDRGGEVTFAIGGSDGLGQNLLDKADRVISFGRVTYPHQLMRVILTEQIYRAFSIIANTPYHK